jgi:hypothetical protein
VDSLLRHDTDSAKSPARLVSGAGARGQGAESRKLSIATSAGRLELSPSRYDDADAWGTGEGKPLPPSAATSPSEMSGREMVNSSGASALAPNCWAPGIGDPPQHPGPTAGTLHLVEEASHCPQRGP